MKHFFACLIFLIGFFSLLSCDQTKEKSLASEKKEKISVICPTYNRHNRHANLYSAFKNQTYENKELLILDDSSSPSDFFITLKDPTVKYQHVTTRDSIGQKRNMLIEMASGSLIAHFDDDDYYAPSYLETMVQSLGAADLIKLSKWLVWKEFDGSLWEWDTRFFDTFHYILTGNNENTLIADTRLNTREELDSFKETNTWGFGFSYVYRKSLWKDCPFGDIDCGEDYDFVMKAKKLNKSLIHMPDTTHMVLHTLHRNSTTAKIYPQYHLEASQATDLLGEGASPWLIIDNL